MLFPVPGAIVFQYVFFFHTKGISQAAISKVFVLSREQLLAVGDKESLSISRPNQRSPCTQEEGQKGKV